jgi:acetolactate synthase-1/2/3 large subunit
MVEDPKDILYELEKAYQIATSGRPGPVWIDVPLDVQGATVQEYKKYTTRLNEPDIDLKKIEKVKELLSLSSKPLVIAGSAVRLSSCYDKLDSFLRQNNIPVVTGPHSGVDVVDNTYQYYCGRIGILGQQTSNEIVQNADLLICLGTRLPVKMTGYNIKEFSPKSKKIYVDIDKNEIEKHKFHIDVKINSDLNLFFDNMSEAETLDKKKWLKYVEDLRSSQCYYHKKHQDITDYASFYYFIDKAPKYFKQAPIITSNGTAHVVTLQMYRLNHEQRLYTNVGCASMGYGLPASIGACIANNRQEVVCIEGDGSIMMNIQELETVSSSNLPIKIIVINNAGYLSIRLTQDSFFNGALHASSNETGVTLPSMKKISGAFNLPYYSIRTNSEIDDTMSDVFSKEGPAIIEIFTHPMERHEPKVTHRGIGKDGKIIPGSLIDMKITETY